MNILHLSDIHFGRNNPKYGLKDPFERHDRILDELIELISGFDATLKPEHILFTGDIAWMGKTREFNEAEIWFKRLLKACNLTGKDISFCVGNHDIDLSGNYIKEDLTSSQLQKIDELYRYENVGKMEPYLYAYNRFCEHIGMEPYVYPSHGEKHYSYSIGYKDVQFSNGKTIRLVSMNTALMMTQKKIPQDQMWLGQEQLRSLIHYGILPTDKNIWYTIGLFHHPDRFLHPSETSTYNGRVATLTILLQLADLLVCGHSESCGRPRINKQLGGGVILSGGAAYYSDEHINSFSMLYISEEKKKMAYIPYVYENGWKDYDFEQMEMKSENRKETIPEGMIYQKVSICCQSDQAEFMIPCDYLEIRFYEEKGRKFVHLDNEKDVMNCYRIDYDFEEGTNPRLPILLNPEQKRNTEYILAYRDYIKFIENASVKGCAVLKADGQVLLRFSGYHASEIPEYEPDFLKQLQKLETYYDVKFSIPDIVTEYDRAQIQILNDIMELDNAEVTDMIAEYPKIQVFDVTILMEKDIPAY